MKEKKTFQTRMVILGVVFLTGCSYLLNSKTLSIPQEPLEYNVEVSAQIIPFFAVDFKGNPVFDLKSEELTLSVNGKPRDIYFLKKTGIQEENGQEEKGSISYPAGEKPVERTDAEGLSLTGNTPRIKFIIMDAVFNSGPGIRRSKEIAVNLVKNQAVNDRFIILLNTVSGLKYITGPESDKEILIKKIEKLTVTPEKFLRDMFMYEKNAGGITSDISNFIDDDYDFTKIKTKLSDKLIYQTNVRRLVRSLTQFKYALQTINGAKIVFFISEGVKKGAFLEEVNPANRDRKFFKTYLFRYLEEIGKAINNGGSVLYTINSQKNEFEEIRDDNNTGEGSMMYLANEGGGKYFSGSTVAAIVSTIEKTTAAYYELTFTPGPGEKGLMKIDLKCKREGVRLYTVHYTEKTQPYGDMPPEKKKLFAYDVITGGNWSRMVGKVMNVSATILRKEKNGNEELYTIQMPLPYEMRDHKLDVFSIGMDAPGGKVIVSADRSQAKEILNLKVKRNKNMKQFVVIIEPGIPRCIYSEIK